MQPLTIPIHRNMEISANRDIDSCSPTRRSLLPLGPLTESDVELRSAESSFCSVYL